jgi:hypothetical protein
MLLQKLQIKDKQGGVHECRRITVPDKFGNKKTVELLDQYAHRYDQIDVALKAMQATFMVDHSQAFDSTDPLAWNVSQLAYTEAQVLARARVPATIYQEMVPVSYEAPAWAETVEAWESDETGIGDIVSPVGTDMPLADAKFGRRLIDVKGGKIGYHYDVQELIASAQLKRPLSEVRMQAAMNGWQRHMQVIALRGDTTKGIYGFWNQPNTVITPVIAPTGSWDSASTSPLSILGDLNKAIAAVYENSGTTEVVTDIAMPVKALNALATRVLAATSGGVTVPVGTTLLDFLKEHNLSKTLRGVEIKFHGIPVDPDSSAAGSSLDYAGVLKHDGSAIGATPSSRVVYWVRKPERLVMHQPLTLTFLAPQPRGTDVIVPGRYRFTPVDVRYPKMMYYQDCVLTADPQS